MLLEYIEDTRQQTKVRHKGYSCHCVVCNSCEYDWVEMALFAYQDYLRKYIELPLLRSGVSWG